MERRFIVVFMGDDGKPFVGVYNEEGLSNVVDMSDCCPFPILRIHYLTDNGDMELVNFGEVVWFYDEETQQSFGNQSILVDGRVVGTVSLTDH